MNILNTLTDIPNIYKDGSFDIHEWEKYINLINPKLYQLCFDDMSESISTGLVSFEKDYLPILNNVFIQKEEVNRAIKSFDILTNGLERELIKKFNKSVDVEIVLYLGLCNGAGWVTKVDDKVFCLLGIEKIIELNWQGLNEFRGLLSHELGHVFHNQYGVLERKFESNKDTFLWQLFTEGVAMYFEQMLFGDFEYFHQDCNGWKLWCEDNLNQIKIDFYNDLNSMTFENQRYFGDWVKYYSHSDVGYFLAAKFIRFVCKKYSFDKILIFDIDKVSDLYIEFVEQSKFKF